MTTADHIDIVTQHHYAEVGFRVLRLWRDTVQLLLVRINP